MFGPVYLSGDVFDLETLYKNKSFSVPKNSPLPEALLEIDSQSRVDETIRNIAFFKLIGQHHKDVVKTQKEENGINSYTFTITYKGKTILSKNNDKLTIHDEINTVPHEIPKVTILERIGEFFNTYLPNLE